MTSFQVVKVHNPTRNQRFLAALERNHSKKKEAGKASSLKKYLKLKERKLSIQEDADRNELLDWIVEIQEALKLSNKEFADALGLSVKSIQGYRSKIGYLPSMKTFRKLLELERLTRISVTVKKNNNYLVSSKPVNTVVIK